MKRRPQELKGKTESSLLFASKRNPRNINSAFDYFTAVPILNTG